MSLKAALNDGKFVITMEILPPNGVDTTLYLKSIYEYKNYVDAINATDNQLATVRLSSLASSWLILNAGSEPIMQITARDRNRLALQSDFLAAYTLGIRNILCLYGDSPEVGSQPATKPVYDLMPVEIIKLLKKLESGYTLADEPLNGKPTYFVGCAANPCTENPESECSRLVTKLEAGAEFIQTQSVYDISRLERFLELYKAQKITGNRYLLIGIMPLRSLKFAKYVKKIPGIYLPDELVTRMKNAQNEAAEGLKITIELIDQILEFKPVNGFHFMPIKSEHLVPEIIKGSRLQSRRV